MSTKTQLVAFAGYARSGKNTAAQALEGVEVAFADRLKQMLAVGLDLTHAQLYGDSKAEPIEWLGGVTPRRIMETLGTNWGRELIHPDIWVEATRLEIMRHMTSHHDYPYVIVTDLRMENEAELIRELGGTIIHIRRGAQEGLWARVKRRFGPKSERTLKVREEDEVIHNDGTVEDLHYLVRNCMRDYH